jgi:hypothetical protein
MTKGKDDRKAVWRSDGGQNLPVIEASWSASVAAEQQEYPKT